MSKVGIVVGNIRENPFSQKLANNLVELFQEGYETKFIKITNLPLYNQDSDDNVPEVKFRQISVK